MKSPLLNMTGKISNGATNRTRFIDFQPLIKKRKKRKQTNEDRITMNRIKTCLLEDLLKSNPEESLFTRLTKGAIRHLQEEATKLPGTMLT